jgi:hypothetical protein
MRLMAYRHAIATIRKPTADSAMTTAAISSTAMASPCCLGLLP